jgi:SET domain-containing protein
MKIRLKELRKLIREMLVVQTMVGPSKISGDGLYAAEFIPSGAVVSQWVNGFDGVFPKDYSNILSFEKRMDFEKFASTDGTSWFLSGDDGIYFNHSDSPNIRMIPGRGPRATWDRVAIRDIYPGEELTMDYSEIE